MHPGLPGLTKNDKFGLFCIDWPRNFTKFIKHLAFKKIYRSLYSKIKTFSVFKTEFGIFQLQAPGHPAPGNPGDNRRICVCSSRELHRKHLGQLL